MKLMQNLFAVFALLVPCAWCEITITSNRYNGIVIAISPDVPKNETLIQCIKDTFTQASRTLYNATQQRTSFGDIEILVPRTWTSGIYEITTNRSYENSDIRLTKNAKFVKTVQYGGCGEPGKHTLLPYELFSSINFFCFPYTQQYHAKVIVHEFAHLRFGVFDEYDPENRFYLSTNGVPEATRCSTDLGARLITIGPNGLHDNCVQNPRTALYESNCFATYRPNEQQSPSSLMFRPDLSFTETFCHNNASDPVNLHNTEAPNDQNRICNQKSVWEVIMTSRDFDSGQNQPNFDLDTVPNFRVVIPSTSRIVLVLDISGSMSTNDRLTKMGQIVQGFIEDKVSSSAQVGIVQFGSVATVLSFLLSMNNQANKDSLVGVIPAFTSGSTAIGRGILSGIDVLENGGNSAAGGTIIILTDGNENVSPYVADIHSNVTGKTSLLLFYRFYSNNDVTLHTIFFAQAIGNADLVNLTTSTGGSSYIGDDFNILSAFGAFDALARTEDGNLFDEVFEISSVSFTGTFHNDTVLMDSTIGNNTVFIFAWIGGSVSPVIRIVNPSGCESVSTASFSGCSQPVDFQTGSTTTRALVTGIAEPGAWRYDITSSVEDTFTILVSSRASDVDDPPYMVETSTGSVDITSLNPQAIYARVTKESQPVLGADVTAIIEIPASPARKFEKILLDNGAGADVTASDGVYSGFFTTFTNQGRYSLQVKVTNGNFTRVASDARSLAAKQTSRLAYFPSALPDGTVVALPVTDSTDVTEVANFTRIVTSPSFTYSGTVISLGVDSFPPNQITDLSATQLDVFDPNSGIVLSFTAPGDELDVGTASRYDIQYAFSPDTLDPSFGATSNLINSSLVPAPTPAGTLEVININIPIPSKDRGTFRIALGVRATDDAGKTGDISNQVVVTYFSRAVELIHPPTPSTEPPVTGAFVLAVVIAALVYLRSLKARRLPDERPAGKGYDNPDFDDRAYCVIPRPSVISTSRMSAYAEHIYDDVCVTDGRV